MAPLHFSMHHFLLPEQRPLWGVSAPLFPVHPIGPFSLWKRPKQKQNEKSLPHSWLHNEILFVFQLCPSCAPHPKPFTNPACNYHQEESRLFWAAHLRFHTGPVCNTWTILFRTASPLGAAPFQGQQPGLTPSPRDSPPFQASIPRTAGNGSFSPDLTDKTNSSSLPGAAGFSNTSM